jgi:hypothetical protein
MQADPEQAELVRCLACRSVYEQALTRPGFDGSATCPHCGEVAWLAAWIPVEETGAVVPA